MSVDDSLFVINERAVNDIELSLKLNSFDTYVSWDVVEEERTEICILRKADRLTYRVRNSCVPIRVELQSHPV